MYIRKGSRDDTLFRMARAAASKVATYEELLRKVQQINRDWCRPPLPEWQAAQKAEQAWKYELEARRDVTEEAWIAAAFIEAIEQREISPSRTSLEVLVKERRISQELMNALLEER